jgi:hypothetical protein
LRELPLIALTVTARRVFEDESQEEVPLRILASTVLVIGVVLAAVHAQAQTYDPSYPVCMKVYTGSIGGGGEWNDCTFTSLHQCAATASGRAATCMLNPYFARAQMGPSRYIKRRGY